MLGGETIDVEEDPAHIRAPVPCEVVTERVPSDLAVASTFCEQPFGARTETNKRHVMEVAGKATVTVSVAVPEEPVQVSV